MKTKKRDIKENDYLNANKRADREMELSLHDKQVTLRMTKVHRSKKKYCRKRVKSQSKDWDIFL